MPNAQPQELWHHHSIPAFDETGRSTLELGGNIESNKTQIYNPSVLVSKLNPRKSRVSLVLPIEGDNHCCSTEFICYAPIDGDTVLAFWKHFFEGSYFKKKLTKIAIGSTNSHTRASPKETLGWDVPIVTKLECQKIADILDTLDNQIRETEAIIDKLQQVKQGLLHDLLTRGVDENGQLRPPKCENSQYYYDSGTILGHIPRSWTASSLGALLSGIDGGWSPNCQELKPSPGEWGVLKVSAVTGGKYKSYESKVLPPNLKPKPDIEVKQGDVILTRANGNPELVAKTVYVDATQEKLMLSDKLLRLTPNKKLLPLILMEIMSLMTTQSQVLTLSSGSSGQKNISQQQLRDLVVVKIPIDEQIIMQEQLVSSSKRISNEAELLKKLYLKKSGLTDDLITGKVRVTDLIKQAKAS